MIRGFLQTGKNQDIIIRYFLQTRQIQDMIRGFLQTGKNQDIIIRYFLQTGQIQDMTRGFLQTGKYQDIIIRYRICRQFESVSWVVGKKCNPNPNPNRKLTEMSRTGNLLLLISSLILRCFSKTFSFIVYFYILETHRL